MFKIKLEVCVDSVDSAIAAEKGGADRLELCGSLIIGGTTASPVLYKEIRKHTSIPIKALIRPRFGDFCYSQHEFDVILGEVDLYRKLGADGIVVGCLTPEGAVHMQQMEQIMNIAGNMRVSFHRAFDVCENPYTALAQIKELGIDTVLTSGQKNSFIDGQVLLKELVQLAGDKIEIMPGAGVTSETLKNTAPLINANAYHMSGKTTLDSTMKYRKKDISMGTAALNEYEIWQTDESEIRKVREVLDGLK